MASFVLWMLVIIIGEVVRCVLVYCIDGRRYPRVVLYRCFGHELWVPGLPQLSLWLQKKKKSTD